MKDTTIVIPAYKPTSLLIDCVNSIIKNTDPDVADILVVCNGCDRDTANFLLESKSNTVRFVWYNEPIGFTKAANIGLKLAETPYILLMNIGFTKAANIGLKLAETPYILLMNTDVTVLDWPPKNLWLTNLIDPLKQNPKTAVTGICNMYFNYGLYIPFFLVGLRKTTLEQFNYLDQTFSPGYGEDIDFCFKAVAAGYDLNVITNNTSVDEEKIYTAQYPIYHKGQGTFGSVGEQLAGRGHDIVYQRYFQK